MAGRDQHGSLRTQDRREKHDERGTTPTAIVTNCIFCADGAAMRLDELAGAFLSGAAGC